MEIRNLNLKYYWLSNSLQFLPFVYKFSANLYSVIIDACVQCAALGEPREEHGFLKPVRVTGRGTGEYGYGY